MHVQQNPPRSPFTKGEDDLFGRDMVSCDAPLLGKGGWGDFIQGQGFHLTTRVDLWIAPYGGQNAFGSADAPNHPAVLGII